MKFFLFKAAQRDIDKGNEGPDGKYTFRRKKGVIYHAVSSIYVHYYCYYLWKYWHLCFTSMLSQSTIFIRSICFFYQPRYDSIGNWPWEHPVEGGTGVSQYSFAKTSISKECRCIGFARRRLGRGGRINFDRVYTPFDKVSSNNQSDKNEAKSLSINSDRVPPWLVLTFYLLLILLLSCIYWFFLFWWIFCCFFFNFFIFLFFTISGLITNARNENQVMKMLIQRNHFIVRSIGSRNWYHQLTIVMKQKIQETSRMSTDLSRQSQHLGFVFNHTLTIELINQWQVV